MASTSDMRRALKSLLTDKVSGLLMEFGNTCHSPDTGQFCEAPGWMNANQKKRHDSMSTATEKAAYVKKVQEQNRNAGKKKAPAKAVKAPVVKAPPVSSPSTGAVNRQGEKPSAANGYPTRYDGHKGLSATVHAAIDRAGDIGLDKVLAKVEANGKTRLENMILNDEVVLYKPARTVTKVDKRSGKSYEAKENPVYTFDLPEYGFKLGVAINPQNGQIRTVVPTNDAQEVKIARWKKENYNPTYWQEKNRADIKEQVLTIDAARRNA